MYLQDSRKLKAFHYFFTNLFVRKGFFYCVEIA